MGMDVSGINPVLNVNSVEPDELEDYWQATDEEREAYWDAKNKYREENPGVYFRANCWSWRPIHDFMSEHAGHLYDEEIEQGMVYNDGAGLPGEVCVEAANVMQVALDKMEGDVRTMDTPDFQLDNETGKLVDRDDDTTHSPYGACKEHLQEWVTFVRNSGGFEVW